MNIKILSPDDDALHIDAIRLLNDGSVISLERSAMLLAELTYVFIVALTDSGVIMGRIYGHVLHRYEQTDLLLYEVDVVEEHQRKGVGQAMMEFVKTLCVERGYTEAWVLTEDENASARALYSRAGGVVEAYPTVMYVFSHL